MNTLKRTFAILLCLLLTLTCLAGCHKKGEIAVKIGDIEFTSGYYSCVLISADSEARALVEEDLSEEGDLPTEIEYWKYKVEDTDYVEWVESKTLENLKKLAAIKTLCKEAGVTLDAETESLSDTNADYLWDYGYSELMENNGVSKETFKQYWRDSYLEDAYFEHLYSEGGEKAITADAVSKQLADNYVLVNMLEVSFTSLGDEEKADKENQFTAYETALKDGSKTFEEIYLEYNNLSAEDHTHDEAEEGELQPLDHHATVLGSEDTDSASDHFEIAKAMAVGEIKIVTLEDNAGLVLLVKKDISADPYYLDDMDTTLRYEISGEDFTNDIEEYGKKLNCDVNTYSTKQFKVKKIKYPETTY